MEITDKFEEKAKKVSNRQFNIPQNSKQADYIQEASEWIGQARQILDDLIEESITELTPHVTRNFNRVNRAVLIASQWLDKAGVTQTEPPSIENERK